MIVLLVAKVDVLPIHFESIPLEIRDDVDYLRGLAWDERDEKTGIIERLEVGKSGGERMTFIDSLANLFYIENGNVLTADNLKRISDIESELFEEKEFLDEYCLLDYDNNCTKPYSVIR